MDEEKGKKENESEKAKFILAGSGAVLLGDAVRQSLMTVKGR